jgi:hypothetical protein
VRGKNLGRKRIESRLKKYRQNEVMWQTAVFAHSYRALHCLRTSPVYKKSLQAGEEQNP